MAVDRRQEEIPLKVESNGMISNVIRPSKNNTLFKSVYWSCKKMKQMKAVSISIVVIVL